MNEAEDKTCEGCGSRITPDDIVQRRAGLVHGVLLCAGCVERKRREAMQNRATTAQATAAPAAQAVTAVAPAHQKDDADEVLTLVSDDEMPSSKSQMIRSFAEGSTLSGTHHDEKLKRPVGAVSDPPTRCRTFHAKLTEAGLANMDDVMNEWLDSHRQAYVKNVTSSIGVFESKTKEPHLFVTVFY